MSDPVSCAHQRDCSGCDHLGLPHAEQLALKERLFLELLPPGLSHPELRWLAPAPSGLRDRLDFQARDGAFGLFEKNGRRLVEIHSCPQLSPPLARWYAEFRSLPAPLLRRASFRLRVSPRGDRGLWLDLANLDIKELLEERTWLESWLQRDVIIEMGQRRKRVVKKDGALKLADPIPHPWFRTRWRDQDVDLYGAVGSFTQPSLVANRAISDWVINNVRRHVPRHIVELGAGQGNLSFPALSGEARLTACENDGLALAGFRRGLDELALQGVDLRSRVRIEEGDFLGRSSEVLGDADLLLANPPRAGLGKLLDSIEGAASLATILYMSCHPSGLAADAARLQQMGFEMSDCLLLDQFPQTRHLEILSVWTRSAK